MPQIPGVFFGMMGAAMAALMFPWLRRADTHPWGLAGPSLDPVALREASRDRRGPIEITLAYGDPLEVSAPLVEVRTALPGRGGDAGAPQEALAHLAHWDAAVARRDFLALYRQPRPASAARTWSWSKSPGP